MRPAPSSYSFRARPGQRTVGHGLHFSGRGSNGSCAGVPCVAVGIRQGRSSLHIALFTDADRFLASDEFGFPRYLHGVLRSHRGDCSLPERQPADLAAGFLSGFAHGRDRRGEVYRLFRCCCFGARCGYRTAKYCGCFFIHSRVAGFRHLALFAKFSVDGRPRFSFSCGTIVPPAGYNVHAGGSFCRHGNIG